MCSKRVLSDWWLDSCYPYLYHRKYILIIASPYNTTEYLLKMLVTTLSDGIMHCYPMQLRSSLFGKPPNNLLGRAYAARSIFCTFYNDSDFDASLCFERIASVQYFINYPFNNKVMIKLKSFNSLSLSILEY